MNSDIYERHQIAVVEWKRACEAVENAEDNRNAARARLDEIGQELLASCADSKRIEPIVKRGRKAKVNGVSGPFAGAKFAEVSQ